MSDTKLGALIVYNRKHIHILNTRDIDIAIPKLYDNDIKMYVKDNNLHLKISQKDYPTLIRVGLVAIEVMRRQEMYVGYSVTKGLILGINDPNSDLKPFQVVSDNDSRLHSLKYLSRDRVYELIMNRIDSPKTFRVYSWNF